MGKKQSKKAGSDKRNIVFEARLVEAGASEALAAVEEVGDKAADLVDLWIRNNNAAAVTAVAHSESAPASARKAARRGLNVFKSRGIALPDVKPAAPALQAKEAPTFEAWFIPPDQSGIATYTIGSSVRGQRYHIADIRVHETAGVIEMNVGEATGGSIRDSFRDMEQRVGFSPAPVPVEWARWRIAEGRKRNAASGLILPLGFDTASDLLEPVPEVEPEHPTLAAGLAVTDEDLDKRVAGSAHLHNDPEFRGWLPEIQFVQELLTKVGQRIGPEPEKEHDRINVIFDEEIKAAADRFFTPEVRERLAQRMRDAAVSSFARAGRERALDVLAVAEAARRCGLITSPPSDVPFLRSFFQKALAVVAASSGGQIQIPVPGKAEADPSRGVVAPPEALEEAARSAARRSEDPKNP
jgi:hypothetical protein